MTQGLVIKAQSGFFVVHTANGEVVCKIRGKLKQVKQDTDLVAVGDTVTISDQPDGTGLIESVDERIRVLARRKPSPRGRGARADEETEREAVILANPDQAVFVFSCAQPEPRFGMLDRFLVVAESQQLPAVICANKTDLVGIAAAKELFGIYERIGYRVICTSAVSGDGLSELRQQLSGRISALSGPSGVGKSSLMNAIQPGLGIAVSAVSDATSKGRHTTVHPELIALAGGGWVADTPGIRALALYDIEPYEVDGYFPDIRDYVARCAFSDCSHIVEADCAVREAVAAGMIDPRRYESFQRIRSGQS